MGKQNGFTLPELLICLYVLLAIGGGFGWVWNIIKIVHADFAVLSGMLILRIVGVFVAPLGAILGYC